jgi:hypothetical protein
MFYNATSFDQNIGAWDVTSLENAANMFTGVALSSFNYDGLLIGWGAQILLPGVPFDGGNSIYCSDAAVAARTKMMTSDAWGITDGGQECPAGTCNVNIVSGETVNSAASLMACEILAAGPSLSLQERARVNLYSGWEIHFLPGFSVEKGATLNANVCGQSLCMRGDLPMPYGCHPCVDRICDVDPYCCLHEFDGRCLTQVDTVCGLVCE